MNNNKLIELSGKVGKAYKILPCWNYSDIIEEITWLHEDSTRCFELAIENNLWIKPMENFVRVYESEFNSLAESYLIHDNDKLQATRVAILKKLLKFEDII